MRLGDEGCFIFCSQEWREEWSTTLRR
jgi:hypothetical protein